MGRIIEVTFLLIVAYLVLKNAQGFSLAIQSLGSVYAGSVKALQGR